MNKLCAIEKITHVQTGWEEFQREAERVLVEAQERVRKIKRSLAWIKKKSQSGASLPKSLEKALEADSVSSTQN
jgi:hypothetical protein